MTLARRPRECHWRVASEKCRKSAPVVWLASSLKNMAACWLWLKESVYLLRTGGTPVAPYGAGGLEWFDAFRRRSS